MVGKNRRPDGVEIGFWTVSMSLLPVLALQQRNLSGWLILVLVIIVLMALLAPMLLRRDDDQPSAAEAPPTKPSPALKDAGSATVGDDLTRIVGIDSEIANQLQVAGIDTFAALAAADPEVLRQRLQAQRLEAVDPDTWPAQAALAAAGKWEALQVLQDDLAGG